MTEKEILEEFKYRYINLKTNNYIFCEVNDFKILDSIPNICDISIPESSIDIEYALNIKIDLKEVNVKDILSYTLQLLKESSLLDVTLDYTLEFNNKFDLLRFQNILHNYGIVVQLIFYNLEELELEDQMLFNEIYYFNSIFFNANSFIKDNNFLSYFLSNERVLDNRENYTKIKMVNRMMKENEMKEYGLQELLELEQEYPEENSFLELHEPAIIDEFTYRRLQNKKYGYAVRNSSTNDTTQNKILEKKKI